MSWVWDWKKTLNRKIAIDEIMIALVELAHEIEQELGDPPWVLSKILNTAITSELSSEKPKQSENTLSIQEIPIETILQLPNTTIWPMIYTGLAQICNSNTKEDESKVDPKLFDIFLLKIEKEDDTIDLHGFKKLMDLEESSKKDIVKALCNTKRITESSMNMVLDNIEDETEQSTPSVFEVGMVVQKSKREVLGTPGWPPFAKEDDTAIIERIDESDSTLFLRFDDSKLWWISCTIVQPTSTSYN